MAKYRKKPVMIEAVQFTRQIIEAHLFDGAPLPLGVRLIGADYHPANRTIFRAAFRVPTLEGDMVLTEGDWIITGIKGERYPCKPDIFAATYTPNEGGDLVGKVVADIVAERRRHVTVEGWTPEHDDEHANGEMAMAAACYAWASQSGPWRDWITDFVRRYWPWDEKWWKPQGGKRRNLVKAGALVVAEIERFDRALAKEKEALDAISPASKPQETC